METLKILSIDFDYVMYPCIKLYNSHVSGSENQAVIWERLEQLLEIDQYLCYDADALKLIAGLILKNVINKAAFIPVTDHEEIVDILKKDKNYPSTKFDITNIDFHHDMYYREEDIAEIKDFGQYNCSDWLGYLYFTDKLENCHWIKAPNSDIYNGKAKIKISGKKDIVNFGNGFDMVFLCLSPQWVPYKYHHLYELLCSIYREVPSK